MKRLAVILMAIALVACQQPTTTPRGASIGGPVAIAPSAARTAAFTSTAVEIGGARSLLIQLDITAVSGTTPTLDVKVQTSVDGTNFCDVAAFTQSTVAARKLIRIAAGVTPQAEVACTDATLAAGTIHQGPLGRSIRIKHALPGGTTPSFTYSLTAWQFD